jgi:hypothetical protein
LPPDFARRRWRWCRPFDEVYGFKLKTWFRKQVPACFKKGFFKTKTASCQKTFILRQFQKAGKSPVLSQFFDKRLILFHMNMKLKQISAMPEHSLL